MNGAERAPFVAAIDEALVAAGFRRRRAEFVWRKRADETNNLWVHINFGLSVINPSFGVEYIDLKGQLDPAAGAVWQVSKSLGAITTVRYTAQTPPSLLAQHLVSIALPNLQALRDRQLVAKELELSDPSCWPVAGTAFRMRLLPLLLACQGQVEAALSWVRQFEEQASSDQLLPSYSAYAQCFRDKYAG